MIESLPTDVIKSFYASFGKLRERVMIRVTDAQKLPPGLPKNVLTLPWIPQQAVLGIKINFKNKNKIFPHAYKITLEILPFKQ